MCFFPVSLLLLYHSHFLLGILVFTNHVEVLCNLKFKNYYDYLQYPPKFSFIFHHVSVCAFNLGFGFQRHWQPVSTKLQEFRDLHRWQKQFCVLSFVMGFCLFITGNKASRSYFHCPFSDILWVVCNWDLEASSITLC